MRYLRIIDGEIKYPYTTRMLKTALGIHVPKSPAVDSLVEWDMHPVVEAPAPAGDVVTELTPALINGEYVQQWSSRAYTPEEKTETAEAKRERFKLEADQRCARELDARVTNVSTAERDSWALKFEEAKTCRASAYTIVGEYLQGELDNSPGLGIRTLADRVYTNGLAYKAMLDFYLGARNVIKAEVEAMTEDELLAADNNYVAAHAAWGVQDEPV